jgi:hypothetical protein
MSFNGTFIGHRPPATHDLRSKTMTIGPRQCRKELIAGYGSFIIMKVTEKYPHFT